MGQGQIGRFKPAHAQDQQHRQREGEFDQRQAAIVATQPAQGQAQGQAHPRHEQRIVGVVWLAQGWLRTMVDTVTDWVALHPSSLAIGNRRGCDKVTS